MPQLKDDIEAFRSTFTGEALTPGDPDYDRSRAIWNGAIDRKPAVIARCSSAGHVAEAVRFAARSGMEIAVRGGGHNYAGHAVCDGGMMIHLGAMNDVTVDPKTQRVICGGGCTWADVDGATQRHGLATPGGIISHTGVAGLTLGGGIGWLTRTAGLACDNLVAAQVVTADGRIVRASRASNAELFWAIRGGGGNFGVVTSFEFSAHEVPPVVNLGLFFFDVETGPTALKFARDYLPTLPMNATGFMALALNAPPEEFVPERYRGMLGHAIMIVGFGSIEEHAELVAPLRDAAPARFELVTPIPFVSLQQMFNESAHWGTMGYEKALYLDDFDDELIDVIGEHAPRKRSPMSFAPVFMLGGAYAAVDDAETSFGGTRSSAFVLNIVGHTTTRADYEADRNWVRDFWNDARPYANGSGSYINFISEPDDQRVRASYGREKYARLARIKAAWDPHNRFHLNANIKPSSQPQHMHF